MSNAELIGVSKEPPCIVVDEKAPDKYIVNPEWQQWRQRTGALDPDDELVLFREWNEGFESLGLRPEIEQDFFPDVAGKGLPAEGAWIIIKMSVHVGKQIDDSQFQSIEVPHLSMWYARPASGKSHEVGPRRKKIRISSKFALIVTPDGTVNVHPHEYDIVTPDALREYMKYLGQGLEVKFLSKSGAFNEDQLFYLRSRGIDLAEAQMLLLPTLHDPNFCYFEFDREIANYFGDGFRTPYLTSENHRRRAESRARRIGKRTS